MVGGSVSFFTVFQVEVLVIMISAMLNALSRYTRDEFFSYDFGFGHFFVQCHQNLNKRQL